MSLSEPLQRQFVEYAETQLPKEAAAVLCYKDNAIALVSAPNVHAEPERFFQIEPELWLKLSVQYQIVGVVHSHPKTIATPSTADRVMCEELAVPWHIYSFPQKSWHMHLPTGYEAPYAGREFIWGVQDCFSLIRDYYWRELKIRIKNYHREFHFWDKGKDLYQEFMEDAQFVQVDSLRKHDVLIIQLCADVGNHGSIYIGNDLILHHVEGRLSNVTPYGGYWLKNTRRTIRHKSLC